MPNKLTPPPPTGIGILDRWLALLWRLLTGAGEIQWDQVSKAGSNLTEIETRNHNDLQTIQGGASNDYYHFTAAQHTDLTDGGDSTLHFHASDRVRANHTGLDPYVPFDTTTGEPSRDTGRMFWDDTNKTVAVHLAGPDVTLQIGQENHIYARNASGATILNGKVVYVSGAQGNRPRITLAKADLEATAVGTIGLATEDIEDTTDGYVTTQGIVNGLDTSAFSEGDTVYLSATTAGALTATEPTGHNYIVRVGTVTRVNPSVGAILVNVQVITRTGNEVILEHIGTSTYSTVQDLQNLFHSAGYVSGGAVTDNGNGTVAIAAGTGAIRTSDSETSALKFFDFAAVASQALTNADLNWVYIDYNAGSPIVTASTTEPSNHHTFVKLATVYRDGTDLHINQTVRFNVGDHASNMVESMQETMGYAHVSGAAISETGTRNLSISAGAFWYGLNRFTTTALNTAVSGTFSTYYQNGLGDFTHTVGQTVVNNTNWDDGTGVLATLSANRYTNRWVYLATDSDVHVIYGQSQSVLLADTLDEQPPTILPAEIRNDSFLIGRIVVRQGTTNFVQVDSSFSTMFVSSAVSNHNDLSGLQGGTSGQYYHLTAAELAHVQSNLWAFAAAQG